MVIKEGIKLSSNGFQTTYIVGDLKKVMVIKTGINAFVQFVVSNRMEHFRVDPAAVITVDDFSHKPEIRLHGSSFGPHFFHEIKVQDIGAV